MKVFVSWSGERSKKVALIMFDWLKDLLPNAEPWMSARSVEAGQWWVGELQSSMQEAEFGILCLTPENLQSPWILFEAGALMMANNKNGTEGNAKIGRVIPLLVGLRKAELTFPLAQFQAVESDRQGFWELALAANQSLAVDESAEPSKVALNKKFAALWPTLQARIQSIQEMSAATDDQKGGAGKKLSDREMLQEVLEKVRNLENVPNNNINRAAEQQQDWEDYFIQGLHHANRRNGRESDKQALYYYSLCKATMPDYLPPNEKARLITYHAAILKRLGRLDEAESELSLALKLATQHDEIADALYNMAGVLSMKGETSQALDCLEKMVERQPWRRLPHAYFFNVWHEPRFQALQRRIAHHLGNEARLLGQLKTRNDPMHD
ncbi:expressed unknown protein [Seminavis robusta]|uniref:TIR domain-containing protein n=1 Tax=Seminavis robusta TaxID=568900 RepID=A0A9N8DPR9_9STRA|nr:expressed unknown protein [Seminavis robusta]|eukprot:Sro269_g103880.1 n/a (382) ;mRNA; r:6447-7592